MNQEPADRPKEGELWVALHEPPHSTGRLAVMEILRDKRGGDGPPTYDVKVHYDTVLKALNDDEWEPTLMHDVPADVFYARLPDEEFHDRYLDCLDLLRDYLTPSDMADLLDGEPSYMTNGERGYEAARFAVLDGLDSAIEENSRLQGHGPGRYARTVERYIEDKPTWVQESVLHHETDIWDTMGFDSDQAARTVELLMLRQQYLDEDHEEDIRDLVNEYDLEYDEYRNDIP